MKSEDTPLKRDTQMSKSTAVYHVDTIGADALAGFFQSFSSAYEQIEQALLLLDLEPNTPSLIDDLIQSTRLIDQSLEQLSFDELQNLTHSLLGLLQDIKKGQIEFSSELSDIILITINDIKTIIETVIDSNKPCVLLKRIPKVCHAIEQISHTPPMQLHSAIKDTLMLLDPSTELIEPSISNTDSLKHLFDESAPDAEELAAYGVEESEDFIFFKSLSAPLESRAQYWNSRNQRMLRLALKMNDEAGRPVDPNQLAAAIYLHDAGMALLPLDIINNTDSLTEEQIQQVREHPQFGFELLRYMKSWQEAAYIILQHHERVDGNGYPFGLKGEDICDGAKIVAIVDAVDARTHERGHAAMLKRPLLRAAMEIGKHADVQFDSYWVNIFRSVFQQMRKNSRENPADGLN